MKKDYRVLLVSFPAQGHINPCLEFAKRLIQTDTNVTFLTANRALNRMISTTPPLQGLSFIGFSDGYEEGLKLGKSIEELMNEQKRCGSEAVEETIKLSAEKGEPFSRVVYTTILPYVGHMAHALEVPSTLLWIQPASVFDIYYYYFTGYGEAVQNHGNDPLWSLDLPGLPLLTIRDLPTFITDPSKSSFALPVFKKHLDILEVENYPKVLVNSFDELEYKALRVDTNLNLVPIGPLIPSAFLDGKDPSDTSFGGDLLEKSVDYIEWLDSKEKGSVIYASFGSYSELPKQQMEEIAKGLIDSQRPFLWVIRKPKNNSEQYGEIVVDFIFGEELKKRGKIVEWCSQVEVLSHASIGCFVSHCGWNSSLESIICGVPFVCFPLLSDQTTNAKFIEDVWEVGVRVEKIEEIVKGSEIKRCVEIVMGEGERGERMRRNGEKWKNSAKEAAKEGGSSYLNLKDFVKQEIRALFVCRTKSEGTMYPIRIRIGQVKMLGLDILVQASLF